MREIIVRVRALRTCAHSRARTLMPAQTGLWAEVAEEFVEITQRAFFKLRLMRMPYDNRVAVPHLPRRKCRVNGVKNRNVMLLKDVDKMQKEGQIYPCPRGKEQHHKHRTIPVMYVVSVVMKLYRA